MTLHWETWVSAWLRWGCSLKGCLLENLLNFTHCSCNTHYGTWSQITEIYGADQKVHLSVSITAYKNTQTNFLANLILSWWWMASPTRWTWVWASSGSWWWTRKSGVLQSMGSQRVGYNWATELNSTDTILILLLKQTFQKHFGSLKLLPLFLLLYNSLIKYCWVPQMWQVWC